MKIQLLGDNTYTPTYGTDGAAAMDFYLPKDVTVPPMRQGYKIPWLVTMDAEDFFTLYREWEAGGCNR